MLNKDAGNFVERVRRALTLPIRARCAELTVLFDRGSTLDLQSFFPVLVENIFGLQGTVSWGLHVPKNLNADFRQLEHFLSPCGPVFKLIYSLLKDPSAKYDFPVMHLPMRVQQMLENPQTHPFYTDLVLHNPQTKHAVSLLLNPFDYYMFHFAYHLINPWHRRTNTFQPTVNQESWNTVYYVLSCDYMLHFLPIKPDAVVLPIIYYSGKNPVQTFQQVNKFAIGSKLVHTNLLSKSLDEYMIHQTVGRHPRNQVWRSESVLTIFADMWLNNDSVSQTSQQINNSFQSSSLPRLLQFNYNELPSSEYMRIVRVLIKQLHAFSASAKIDDSYMHDLKQASMSIVEGKFYIFLRNLIHRWPLDGSFRLLLELWLTYIQPWRYTPDVAQADCKKQNLDADDFKVGKEYLPFVAQNLLTYVVVFQQLLPRFTRVDLVSPKMSMMLYRISKVFNQPNLAALIKEVEQSVENNNSPSHSYNNPNASVLPPLNPTSNWCTNTSIFNMRSMNASHNNDISSSFFNSSRNTDGILDSNNTTFMNSLSGDKRWSAIMKQRIFELEGPMFYYKPLFSVPPASEVFDLLIQIKKSIKVAQELIQIKKEEEVELSGVNLLNLWRMLWEPPRPMDEFTLSERLKVPDYLEKSLEHLKQLFDISELPDLEAETSPNTSVSNGLEISNNAKFLTPESVRERTKRIKYEGDPDLHPIRSTEIGFLVRMLYQLSSYVNANFQEHVCRLYYNQSYLGRLSRQFLTQPTTVYKYDKSRAGSARTRTDLPPRISLRLFASYFFWTYFALGWIGAAALGYSSSLYVCFLFSFVICYKCIKAVFSSPVRHCYPTQGFGNISFNDSF